jgi:hypothetical protein
MPNKQINTMMKPPIRRVYNRFFMMTPPYTILNENDSKNCSECCPRRNLSGALRTGPGDQSCETTQHPAPEHGTSDESADKHEKCLDGTQGGLTGQRCIHENAAKLGEGRRHSCNHSGHGGGRGRVLGRANADENPYGRGDAQGEEAA